MHEREVKLLQMSASVDQAMAAFGHHAKTLRVFFLALRREGFTAPQAMQLAVNYQQVALSIILGEKRDGDDAA